MLVLSAAEPEFIHIDMKDTDAPAVVRKTTGSGEVCWIPWSLTGMLPPAQPAGTRRAVP